MPTFTLLPLLLLLARPAVAGAVDSPSAGQATAAAPAEGFEALSQRARAARDAGRNDEAIAAYRQAVELRPAWDEGLWYLGVLQYETGRCVEADSAFERFLGLKPEAGPGWTIRGVCAFDRGDFPDAIEWLHKGIGLGLGANAELRRVALSRVAQAFVKTGQFELAMGPLTQLAQLSPSPPGLVETTGLALLRLDMLPSELPEGRRDLVQKLGRAGVAHLGQRGDDAARFYAEVVSAYPDAPGVHYAYGVFLLRSGNEKGLTELRRAAELRPDDAMAHLQIAFELLVRGDFAEARASAMKAVELAPGLFAARNALGRVLVEMGETEAGVRELEEAVRLAPDSAETHFALARAYAKAGRAEDAARERAAFAELERRSRTPTGTLPDAGPVHP
jgi:tetratricopeptide (TPR) repeat protein